MHPRFQIVEYNEASPEVKALYEETMREMGLPFVLNWFKCQGANAVLLQGNWAKLRATMLQGQIPFILKQLIIYNISSRRGCHYCAYTHGVIVDSLSKALTGRQDIKLTQQLDSTYIPSAYKTAIRIVTACALNPENTTEDDFEALREDGYSDLEIQELMALADLTNMLNTIADIFGIKVDNELMEAV